LDGGQFYDCFYSPVLDQLIFFMPPSTNALFPRTFLIFYGIFMLLCGLSAGVIGLVALIRNRERSWFVWLAVLPGAFVLFLLLGELLVPH
jgi:hypothetical protein